MNWLPFDRRTGEMEGLLSGFARFALLHTDYERRSIFTFIADCVFIGDRMCPHGPSKSS